MVQNHTSEVLRFLNWKHQGHYAIFSLIGEPTQFLYNSSKLGIVNHSFAFAKKGVPRINTIQGFCAAVNLWLDRDPNNVAVIICDNGYERSGLMIVSLLIFRNSAAYSTAKEAMTFFDSRRMPPGHTAFGSASQRRYIGYFTQRFSAEPKELKLSKVVVPTKPLGMSKLFLDIYSWQPGGEGGHAMQLVKIWTSHGRGYGRVRSGESYAAFPFPRRLRISGDVRLVFGGQYVRGTPRVRLFHIDLNCGFVDHSPTVWDLACLDAVSPRLSLPADFHIQTLFFNAAFLECDLIREQRAARCGRRRRSVGAPPAPPETSPVNRSHAHTKRVAQGTLARSACLEGVGGVRMSRARTRGRAAHRVAHWHARTQGPRSGSHSRPCQCVRVPAHAPPRPGRALAPLFPVSRDVISPLPTV